MKPLQPSDPTETGPYRLLAELGRGGMGRVLLGASPDGRLVAVKQVHARFAADDTFRTRFRREVAASRKVSGAYTAAVMDADADARTPWLASVFVAGPSLGTAVESAGALPEETVRRLAVGLATALVEIHRVGLIHRDLKPENVLLTEDGVRVIDFGIARAAESGDATELTYTGSVIGSPAFMSPEQAEGRELTSASDVFSLGSILAMSVTGHSPFAGTSTAQTLYRVVHAEPDLSAVPPGLRRVVEPCLAKDVAARPTPTQLLDLLGPVTPAERQWPPAVHQLITAQQADIDRLLGAPERTVVSVPTQVDEPPPQPTQPASAPAGGYVPPGWPASAPAAGYLPPPRQSNAGRIAALAVVGVLVVAGLSVGAYQLLGSDEEAPSSGANSPAANVADPGADAKPGQQGESDEQSMPDKYVKMPICSEAAGYLPLPRRDTERDRYNENAEEADTSCGWAEPDVFDTYASVSWNLKRTLRGSENATERQRTKFRTSIAEERPESGLDFGDEAYWNEYDPVTDLSNGVNCDLSVRDGNLVVRVTLSGDEFPAATCESKAEKVAQAALAAMPHS